MRHTLSYRFSIIISIFSHYVHILLAFHSYLVWKKAKCKCYAVIGAGCRRVWFTADGNSCRLSITHLEMTRCGVFSGLFGYIQGFPTRPKKEPCGALIAFLSSVRYPAYGGVCLPQRLSVHLLELPKNAAYQRSLCAFVVHGFLLFAVGG